MFELEAQFEGHVQGIGFRATTSLIAKQIGLTGHVRNLSDGGVHLIAQGAEEQLEKLLADVRTEFSREIARVEYEIRPATQEFSSFTIG